jgi:hypothetical protein
MWLVGAGGRKHSMPLNMNGAFLCSLQCGGCGRCLTCDGLYQPPTYASWAFTSLASIMAVGPRHHAAVTHVGGSAEAWASGSTWSVRLGIHRKCWSEFLCLGGYLAPPRQVGGARAPRDALGRHPSADPRRWRTARRARGRSPIGYVIRQPGVITKPNVISRLVASNPCHRPP